MAGKRALPRELRLATGPQLYALNRAGRLKLSLDEDLEPVSNAQADEAIKHSMGRNPSARVKHSLYPGSFACK
jgi:hypothetical protein